MCYLDTFPNKNRLKKQTMKSQEQSTKNPVYNISLSLTKEEIEYLRNSTSDLGYTDPISVSLQLKIANSLLDSGYKK